MSYTVLFREGNEIFSAPQYLNEQLEEHRTVLQLLVDELAATGHLQNSRATKEANGDWWLMLKAANGDLHTYSLFVSRFEQAETINKPGQAAEQKELVIIDPTGAKDSVGGYHPGYWTVTQYASLLEEPAQKLFLKIIDQVVQNSPSPNYRFNSDGSISIKVDQQNKPYNIVIDCRAEWR